MSRKSKNKMNHKTIQVRSNRSIRIYKEAIQRHNGQQSILAFSVWNMGSSVIAVLAIVIFATVLNICYAQVCSGPWRVAMSDTEASPTLIITEFLCWNSSHSPPTGANAVSVQIHRYLDSIRMGAEAQTAVASPIIRQMQPISMEMAAKLRSIRWWWFIAWFRQVAAIDGSKLQSGRQIINSNFHSNRLKLKNTRNAAKTIRDDHSLLCHFAFVPNMICVNFPID